MMKTASYDNITSTLSPTLTGDWYSNVTQVSAMEEYDGNITIPTEEPLKCPEMYFICPDEDPRFDVCASMRLREDLEVGLNVILFVNS